MFFRLPNHAAVWAMASTMGLQLLGCSPNANTSSRTEADEDGSDADVRAGRSAVEIAGVNLNYDNARAQVLKAIAPGQISYTFRAVVLDASGKLKLPPGKDPSVSLEWSITNSAASAGSAIDISKICKPEADNLRVLCSVSGMNPAAVRLVGSLRVSQGSKSREELAKGLEIDSLSLVPGPAPQKVQFQGIGFDKANLVFVGKKDCMEVTVESAVAMSCRMPAGVSGEQTMTVVTPSGSEASAKITINPVGSMAPRGDELALAFVVKRPLPNGPDDATSVGMMRFGPSSSWTPPEFMLQASSSTETLIAPSIIRNPFTANNGAGVFALSGSSIMESHVHQSTGAFSPSVSFLDGVFQGQLLKVVLARSPGVDMKIGALALVKDPNTKIVYSETTNLESWSSPVTLSTSTSLLSFDHEKAALQLQFDGNGTPHVVFENRTGDNGGGEAVVEGLYGYRSGAGWNFSSPDLLNKDHAGGACFRNSGMEYLSPVMDLDAKGAVHLTYICNDLLSYATNASGIWSKKAVAVGGGASGAMLTTQIRLSPGGEPFILAIRDTALEVWSKNGNAWSAAPVTSSSPVLSATLAFDGPGRLHVLWTGNYLGEQQQKLRHATRSPNGAFTDESVIYEADNTMTLSPYHAVIDSAR